VHRKVSLAITIEIWASQRDPIGDRRLKYRCRYGLALPVHRPGKPQID